MATFITTVTFTEQGVKNIKETRKRADAFEAIAKEMGAQIKNVYWALGPFDGAIVFDAPDDETATALILNLASKGNVQTQTARVFQGEQMDQILSKVS